MNNQLCSCLCALFAAVAVYSADAASVAQEVPQQDSAKVACRDTTVQKRVVDGPCMDFGDDTEYDFGKIRESGGKQTGTFTFKNSGNKPLVVTKVMVSCKCVNITFPKKPVAPGAEGTITVTYDPKKQKGIFHKAIQVYSNDPQARFIILIKGEVVE